MRVQVAVAASHVCAGACVCHVERCVVLAPCPRRPLSDKEAEAGLAEETALVGPIQRRIKRHTAPSVRIGVRMGSGKVWLRAEA